MDPTSIIGVTRCVECGQPFAHHGHERPLFPVCNSCKATIRAHLAATEAPGVRFYNALIAEYEFANKHIDLVRMNSQELGSDVPMKDQYEQYLFFLRSIDTKRILFDSRQAAVFAESGEVPEQVQSKLHWPFPQFYMEFTEPILLHDGEPGYDDYVRAVMVLPGAATMPPGNFPYMSERKDFVSVTFFMTVKDEDDGGNRMYVDRTFMFNLKQGWTVTRGKRVLESPVTRHPKFSPDPDNQHNSTFPYEIGQDEYIVAGQDAELDGRRLGWWERCLVTYSQLLSWICAYTMAKSIEITQESIPRPQRRLLERKGELRPWHIVKVEPKVYSNINHKETGEGSRHSYRYDVIGFLRFGNHRIKVREDGNERWDHRQTIEWVPPHMRGLDNPVYLPKTYKVEGGKRVHSAFKEYVK